MSFGGPWDTVGAPSAPLFAFFGDLLAKNLPGGRLETLSVKKVSQRGGPDMQSVHACACFMKVDPLGKKSHPKRLWEVIFEILVSEWYPDG